MQSKYFGDKGDFAKLGLLRRLSGLTDPETAEPDLRIGLFWYLTPDNCCTREGGVIGFLRDTPRNRQTFRACDEVLWDTLREIVECGRRCVHQLPRTGLLPECTSYFDAPLQFPYRSPRPMREEIRRLWFAGALQATQGADIVFLDPDNGFGREEWNYRKSGPKFAYLDDLQAFWDRGQSLVLYQHLGMNVPAVDSIRDRSVELRRALNVVETFALRFGSRVFFVIPQPMHEGYLRARIGRLLRGPWGGHFQLVEVPRA